MFRLIMALAVAGVLLPAETIKQTENSNNTHITNVNSNTSPVSTQETMSAIYSLYADITRFCDRNEETCETGKALSQNALGTVRNTLDNLINDENSHADIDKTLTGSVEK